MKVAWWIDWGMIKNRYKMIKIPYRVWIVGTFTIDVYESLTVNVPWKMDFIVLVLGDSKVSMKWLFFGDFGKIVMFWKTRDFRDWISIRPQLHNQGGYFIA